MNQQLAVSQSDELVQKLSRLDGRVRRLALLRGFGLVAVLMTIVLAIGLSADLAWEFDSGTRLAILLVVGVTAIIAVARLLLRPCLQSRSPAEMAAVVEESHPDLRERLTSTVELDSTDFPEAQKGSSRLRVRLRRQTMEAVDGLDFSQTVSSKRAVVAASIGTFALLLLVAPFWSWASSYGLLWSRLIMPWGNFASAGNMYFTVEKGDRVVARNSDVTILVRPRFHNQTSELPDAVWLNRTSESGTFEQRRMIFDEATGTYSSTVKRVFGTFDYNVSATGSRSRSYHVEVVDAPELTACTLRIVPPAYSRMPGSQNDGMIGEIPVFERSELTVHLEFNRPMITAELRWLEPAAPLDAANQNDKSPIREQDATSRAGESDDVAMKSQTHSFQMVDDNRSGTLNLLATREGRFAIRLTDEHGLQNGTEPLRDLVIIRDEPPRFLNDGFESVLQVRAGEAVEIQGDVTDDTGVATLELYYDTPEQGAGSFVLEMDQPGERVVSQRFPLNLARRQLGNASSITFRIRATDQRPVPGPQEAWSQPRVIVIDHSPSSGAESNHKDLQQRLQDILDRLAKNHDNMSELNEQAQSDLEQNKDFQKNDELKPLANQQGDLARRLEELAKRLDREPTTKPLAKKAEPIAKNDLKKSQQETEKARQSQLSEKTKSLQKSLEHLENAQSKLRDLEQDLEKQMAATRQRRQDQSVEQQRPQNAQSDGSRQSPAEGSSGGKPAESSDALSNLSGRDWGRLPGNLRTEMMQAAQRKQTGEYAELIKFYFEEIAKSRQPAPAPAKKRARDDTSKP